MSAEKEKIEIEVDKDLEYSKHGILYCVNFTKIYTYRDQSNYDCESETEDNVMADSIEGLYEAMAHELVDWQLRFDDDPWAKPKIEFGNITVEVETFSMDKLKNTETYKNIGLARELKLKREAEERERLRFEKEQREAKEKEERDLREWCRLRSKFGDK
jgi:hypothetical protein